MRLFKGKGKTYSYLKDLWEVNLKQTKIEMKKKIIWFFEASLSDELAPQSKGWWKKQVRLYIFISTKSLINIKTCNFFKLFNLHYHI